jgi:CBS domain-containing protein
MSTDLVVADLAESCETCLNRMQQARVRHLILLESGRLAGIVSLRDLMAADLEDKTEAITLLNAYVHYIPVDLQTKLRS